MEVLPTLTASIKGEVLIMYLAASTESISAALLAEREERQVPIYFVSRVLQGAKLNYTGLEKLILALVHARSIKFRERDPTKTQIPKDFSIDMPPEEDEKITARRIGTKKENPKLDNTWKLYTNGASSSNGSGLRIAQEIEIKRLAIFADSRLMVSQIKGLFEARLPAINKFLERVKEVLKGFGTYMIEHIRRNQNKKVDALSKLASMTFEHLTKEVLVEVLAKRSINDKEISRIEAENRENWMTPIYE
ncbi:reverse transcriptase domain-containing protein [Tanacetum coccineum]